MKISKSLIGLIFLFVISAFIPITVSPVLAQTESVIYGYVFEDANENGIRNLGEAVGIDYAS